MPKAKKLPSGSWRCRVYVGDEYIDGKRKQIIESVTVEDPSEDGRIKCERLARQLEKSARSSTKDTTVQDALNLYIAKRKRTKSVSTISGYQSLAKNAYSDLLAMPVRMLRADRVQMWMDDYALTHTPKTCRNAYALLAGAVHAVDPSADLTVELPEKEPAQYYTPTDQDIADLLAAADPVMQKAILLAAYGTLRNGEVCALTYGDISGNKISITKDYRWDTDRQEYVLGACKNPQSRRMVIFPPEIIDRLTDSESKRGDRLVPLNPRALSAKFDRLRKRLGLEQLRFHDLRAYAASFRHALGVPDQYIMADGGWKTDAVLKRVYRRAMEDRRQDFADLAGEKFVSTIRVNKE